jgi:hypothetical protein
MQVVRDGGLTDVDAQPCPDEAKALRLERFGAGVSPEENLSDSSRLVTLA